MDAAPLGTVDPCRYLVLRLEELFAGKLKAMIDRHHPTSMISFASRVQD
jgi:hypothetical protein